MPYLLFDPRSKDRQPVDGATLLAAAQLSRHGTVEKDSQWDLCASQLCTQIEAQPPVAKRDRGHTYIIHRDTNDARSFNIFSNTRFETVRLLFAGAWRLASAAEAAEIVEREDREAAEVTNRAKTATKSEAEKLLGGLVEVVRAANATATEPKKPTKG